MDCYLSGDFRSVKKENGNIQSYRNGIFKATLLRKSLNHLNGKQNYGLKRIVYLYALELE
jgi:hypothetical protein